MIVNCSNCKNELKRIPSQIKKSKSGNFFCNKSCSASFNNKSEKRTRENHPNWKSGKSSYSFYKKNSCERCGYDKYKSVLQVHHVDHNRENNSIDNLLTLCPNCHFEEHIEKYGGNFNKPESV